ncbi:MAG TPA: peptide MFS transporter, partial [Gemmataceae bacterium]|nr:peptide MFS transporter [Gemmataceae bacterium]
QIMLIAWVAVALWVAFVIFTNRRQHPKVLFFLFLVELWERFSYYGMRALLILYLTGKAVTGGFAIDKDPAYGIYAAYGALVYLTPLAGGFLADKLLGFRNAIIWGAILMAAGQFTLATSSGTEIISQRQYEEKVKQAKDAAREAATAAGQDPKKAEAEVKEPAVDTLGKTPQVGSELLLLAGLALLVTGNGFFKPNISSLIGRFYQQGDPRRDGAFTIFYMGINIGAFLTPLTCGAVGELEGWHYGFLLAGTGMIAGLLIFLYTVSRGLLEHHGDPPAAPAARDSSTSSAQLADPAVEAAAVAPLPGAGDPKKVAPAHLLLVALGTLLFLPVAGALLKWNDAMDILLGVVGALAVGTMLVLSFQYQMAERQRMWVIVVLLFFTAVFWSFFELAGSALNIFTRDFVDRKLAGFDLTTTFFQSVNALFIMLFAPVFAWMWVKLSKSGWEPPAPVKFAIGLALLGAGFLVLIPGRAAAVGVMVPAVFLILLYLLHTLGELALSPVGLSLVTKLAPAKIVGFMMGFWFLSSAIAHQAGKWISRATEIEESASAEQKMDAALQVFMYCGVFAIGSALLLLVISPILKKWMHGVK